MARVETVTAVTKVTLTLDAVESGFLLSLLVSHVAGSLAQDDGALGKIRVALAEAGVTPLLAYNRAATGQRHAVLDAEPRSASGGPLSMLSGLY